MWHVSRKNSLGFRAPSNDLHRACRLCGPVRNCAGLWPGLTRAAELRQRLAVPPGRRQARGDARSWPTRSGVRWICRTTGPSKGPTARRTRAALVSFPAASAGTGRRSPCRRRARAEGLGALRRRLPRQRRLDQRPAPGPPAVRLLHVRVRPHAAPALRPVFQRAGGARGSQRSRRLALVPGVGDLSPRLAEHHRPGSHRVLGHLRHHAAWPRRPRRWSRSRRG